MTTTKNKLVALFQLINRDFYNRRNSAITDMTLKLSSLQTTLVSISKNIGVKTEDTLRYSKEDAEKDFYKTFPMKKILLYKIYNYEPSINYLQFRTIVANLLENILRSDKNLCWFEKELEEHLIEIGNMYDDVSTVRKY